jgi:23S rRNA G2445 N2-methylase RlmL
MWVRNIPSRSNDACNIPANINRKEFAFEKWHDWDNELFDNITTSLLKECVVSLHHYWL